MVHKPLPNNMGNTNVSPEKHAKTIFGNFVMSIKFSNMKESLEETKSYLMNEFKIFLSDIMVNDKVFCQFDENEKPRFMGYILMRHLSFMQTESSPTMAKAINNNNIINACCDSYDSKTSIVGTLNNHLSHKYCWDGSSFLRWDESQWVVCDESEINCDDFSQEINLTLPLETCGFT